MTTDVMPEIDWDTFPESDGEPMAETQANATQMTDLIFALSYVFEIQGRGDRTAVAGNQLMYWNPSNGREHIAPDVYVIFNYPPPAPGSWRTWEHGKFPEIVFEITSPSTQDVDVSERPGHGKRWRYAQLGVKEYYIYDPQDVLRPRLQGFYLEGKRLIPLEAPVEGSIVSPLMGVELRVVDEFLKVVDPRNGEIMRTATEERRARIAAEQARVVAEQARVVAEQARTVAETRVHDAEEQLVAERQARLAMEEALRMVLARLGEPPTPSI